jgi:Uma2 family endonuclease
LWSEEQYLRLTNPVNLPVEFTDGFIEVLPMPTDDHQSMIEFFYRVLYALLQPRGAKVHVASLRIQIHPGKIREPDLLLLLDAKDRRRQRNFWRGADLVIEIVSADNPDRDLVDKRLDYAEGKIPEYWIVNPFDDMITVLTLEGASDIEHGVFRRGDSAASVLIPDFSVNLADVLDADRTTTPSRLIQQDVCECAGVRLI